MYGDFDESYSKELDSLEATLTAPRAVTSATPANVSRYSSHQSGSQFSASLDTSAQLGTNLSSSTRTTTTEAEINIEGSATDPSGQTPSIPVTLPLKYLEVCVNIGEHERRLAEIDVSQICCDSELFQRVKEGYRSIRGYRSWYFLVKPSKIEYVQVRTS